MVKVLPLPRTPVGTGRLQLRRRKRRAMGRKRKRARERRKRKVTGRRKRNHRHPRRRRVVTLVQMRMTTRWMLMRPPNRSQSQNQNQRRRTGKKASQLGRSKRKTGRTEDDLCVMMWGPVSFISSQPFLLYVPLVINLFKQHPFAASFPFAEDGPHLKSPLDIRPSKDA